MHHVQYRYATVLGLFRGSVWPRMEGIQETALQLGLGEKGKEDIFVRGITEQGLKGRGGCMYAQGSLERSKRKKAGKVGEGQAVLDQV